MSGTANLTPSEPDEPLAGSVGPYQQHLAICTGGPPELWATRVEEMEGLFGALEVALRVRGLHKKIKITACDAPSTGLAGLDIFLLPDMLVLPEITIDKVERLATALEKHFEEGLPFDVEPMAGGDHLFVCVHANRDARCGEWGPQLYEVLDYEIEKQAAITHIHQTSHIGGHRFAATCIVYPQGIWYGNLRPWDAKRLVAEHLVNERLLPEFYRGRLGISPCQQVAEAEAARVLLRAHPEYESLTVEITEESGSARAIARARILGPRGLQIVKAEFLLTCPHVWWTVDDEPRFATDR
ncbi:MAG: sucrase ferredoxin [Ardenticatenales bacterium]|nr:sucrase ferredoxin [Ardenticatenales bacterium]